MPVEIDQRRAGKGGGLNAHPLRAHVRRDGHQGHGRQKKTQTGGKAAFGRIGKVTVVQDVGVFADAFFVAQIVHGVD